MCHVGVVAGERTPVITDRNPHLETLMDSRRAVYLPHTEDANMVVDLPNMSGNKKGGATSCGISTIHFRNVFHDAEIDGGGRVCLLWQDSAQVLGGGDQQCVQVGPVSYLYLYLVFSWLIFQQAKYVSGLWDRSGKIVEKVGRVSSLQR